MNSLYPPLQEFISALDLTQVSLQRRTLLTPLIDYIKNKQVQPINLNFICTHNSRRSHLTQVWAQTLAVHFKLNNLFSYSAGTEVTALAPQIIDTLDSLGFQITTLSPTTEPTPTNPIYSIKYGKNLPPIIGFSKTHTHSFNPQSSFAAIMTCSHADDNCPFIAGAEKRIPITYQDPKSSDGTAQQSVTYRQTSFKIATELFYVFSEASKS